MEYSEAAVQDKLGQFLGGFVDERNELKYRIQISNLSANQGKSITVDYPDLEKYDTDLATSLVKQPDLFLKSFDKAALEILNLYNPTHAEKVRKELRVRLRELTDRISLRGVTKEQLNTMIMVAGMVTRTSELRPLAVNAAFRCSNRHITMVEQDGAGTTLKRPIKCETEGCGETRNFELDEKRTEFVDFQVIKIQEMPEELPPGQLPQSFDVNMTGDLVNVARPGDRIVMTGIVKAESETIGGASRKLFITRIEANFSEQLGKRPEEQEISREEEEKIKAIAALPGAYDKLVASVAPAIFGHDLHKEAALLLMVGSPQKTLPDGSTLRGDINILLVGDPGTAKSELLKYVSRVAPRGLFTSGRGSTAAGLTAAVVKEKNGMMMLEAGATVLADLGVACIDEFDKMRVEDRSALHEVMEQQTVSVAKGGIIATLNARTSILAAANPVDGKYDPYKNILDNVALPIPLMTRFDLIFIIRDEPDPGQDETVARHILEMRRKSSFPEAPPIEFELLKKYIIYAKKLDPEFTEEASNRLSSYYIKLRRESSPDQMSVTPRWLEGMIRLSIARARLLLHPRVTDDDALHAVNLVERMLNTVAVDQATKKVDVGVLYNKPVSEKGLREAALEVFKRLSGESKQPVEDKAFYEEIEKSGKFSRDQAEKVFQDMWKSGVIFEIRAHFFKKA
ncbi:MAG: minichromosome maintenance protein MCM [Nitrososphaerales archaeon]